MEKDGISAMAKYVTVNTSVNAAAAYLTDLSERITPNTMSASFWEDYENLYNQYVNENKLLFRSKTINSDNKFVITQVWDSQASRDAWEISSGKAHYDSAGDKPMAYTGYEADSATINSLISNITSEENYIIQVCHSDYRKTGMKIGDPLRNDTVFTI